MQKWWHKSIESIHFIDFEENMDNIINFISSLESSGLLIDLSYRNSKRWNKKSRKQSSCFFDGTYDCLINRTMASSLLGSTFRKGVNGKEKRQEGGILPD